MFPIPTPINTCNLMSVGLGIGGMEGEEHEIPISLHEETSKGRGEMIDNRDTDNPISYPKHSVKQIDPDTGQKTEWFNNNLEAGSLKRKDIIL